MYEIPSITIVANSQNRRRMDVVAEQVKFARLVRLEHASKEAACAVHIKRLQQSIKLKREFLRKLTEKRVTADQEVRTQLVGFRAKMEEVGEKYHDEAPSSDFDMLQTFRALTPNMLRCDPTPPPAFTPVRELPEPSPVSSSRWKNRSCEEGSPILTRSQRLCYEMTLSPGKLMEDAESPKSIANSVTGSSSPSPSQQSNMSNPKDADVALVEPSTSIASSITEDYSSPPPSQQNNTSKPMDTDVALVKPSKSTASSITEDYSSPPPSPKNQGVALTAKLGADPGPK